MSDALTADLVLEGGGVKGIALVGAITVLEEHGYHFSRVAGTSAGSIVGSLVAAGYGGAELAEIMRHIDYRKFRDGDFLDHLGLPGKGLSILFEHGIYEGKYARQWIAEMLAAKHVETFHDLRQDDPGSSLPPEQRFRLVAIASDISRGRLVRFPWDAGDYGVQPDELRVADSVRASMSIPFFYEPVEMAVHHDGEGAGHRHEKCWLVDGGMLSNFPVETFDRTDGKPPRWPTFGIKLSARRDIALQQVRPVHNTVDMAKAMIETMTGFHDAMHVGEPSVLARTIFVDAGWVKATDFDLSAEDAERLYQCGRDGAAKFLATWDWNAFLHQFATP